MTGAISRTLALGAVVVVIIPALRDGPPEQPRPADLPAAQRTLDRAEAFLALRTGAPEERKRLQVGLPPAALEAGAVAATFNDGVPGDPDLVAATPEVVIDWARMDQDTGVGGWDLEAARVALHEQGHAPDDTPGDRLDEGLRDAVALDLVPAFTYAQTGQKADGYGRALDGAYPEWVTWVRALSARATCSRPRGYPARAWVARVSTLDRAGRLAAAESAHTHVCEPP